MKASDIISDALRTRGIYQKEFAEKIGTKLTTFNKRLSENRLTAQQFVDYAEELGYKINLVDKSGNNSLAVRRRGTGPRVKKMIDGMIYDTEKSDALCHTEVEDGWYMELYRDEEGRYFVVHYSFWDNVDQFITECPLDEAIILYRKYSSEGDPTLIDVFGDYAQLDFLG